MLKRFSLWFCTTIFTISVLGIIVSATVTTLVRPNYVKSWVEKSGAYSTLPLALLKEAALKQAKDGGSSDISFSNPLVQAAASAALSPSFLQSSTESVIDGTFSWLDRKVTVPDFAVNIQNTKQSFVDGLGTRLKDRYQALPACAAGVAPTSSDPFQINCRPAIGVDIESLVAEQKAALLANKDFLPEAVITAATFGRDSQGKSIFEQNQEIPKVYSLARLSPLVLGVVALLTGIGVVFLSDTKRKGVHKIGWRLTILGALSLLTTVLGALGLTKAREMANTQGSEATVTVYKEVISNGFDAIRLDVVKTGLIFAGATLLLGIILLVITKNSKEVAATPKSARPAEPEAVPATKPQPTAAKTAAPKPTTASIKPNQSAATSAPTKPKPRPKRTLIQ